MKFAIAGLVLATLTAGLTATAGTATAVVPAAADPVASLESAHGGLGKVVSDEPVAWSPQVRDGQVWAIAQTGDTMVVGGSFTTVRAAKVGSSDLTRSNVFSFDAATGSIHGFSPVTDGRVSALAPGKVPGTVYVAGSFKSLDGRTGRVFLLDAKTGAVQESFAPAGIDGPVTDLALVGDRLYLGGSFTAVGGWKHSGLAAVNADTGAADHQAMNIQLQGNHNWTPTNGWTRGYTGTTAFDISPDGSTMAVVGNFKTVDGLDLDQALLLNLSGGRAVVADWQTDSFDAACSKSFDSYVRDVKWSPDGGHFSIVTTGAGFQNTLCDSISTWAAGDRGQQRRPLWVEEAGGDSLYSVAHTDSAVYAGGHQRWGNNRNGRDFASYGAVPRPSLTAADPNGLVPIDWNPGRNPRGVGILTMYTTEAGVWMGSDTDWYGDFEVFRPRLAFFPAAGGRDLAAGAYQELPGYLYRIGDAGVQRHFTDGGSIGEAEEFPAAGLDASRVRGAFVVDDALFHGSSDGYLYRRSFDGSSVGPAVKVDPYNDEKWSTVPTESGSSVYRGKVPQMYGQFSTQIAGLEARDNTLYYTRPGSNTLYRTGFSADSGIIEPFDCYRCSSPGGEGQALAGSLSRPGDFVFFGGDIVYVDTGTGHLMRAPLTDTGVGASTTLDTTRDYRGRALFLSLGPNAMPNQPPSASFTATCDALDCTFDASASTDPDGTIASHTWDFGDGTTGTGTTPTHTYPRSGDYTATLTTTDNRGAATTTSRQVAPVSSGIEFVGASAVNRNITTVNVPIPQGVKSGDTLVLTIGSPVDLAQMKLTGAGSWSPVGSYNRSTLWMAAYSATAKASDLGGAVTVTLPSWAKLDVQILAYRGPAGPLAVSGYEASATLNPATITAPAVNVSSAGTWAVRGWYTRSGTVESISVPTGLQVRGAYTTTGSGRITSAVTDHGSAVPLGSLAALTAIPSAVPGVGGGFTVLIAPA
jgi:PKD repeat protein